MHGRFSWFHLMNDILTPLRRRIFFFTARLMVQVLPSFFALIGPLLHPLEPVGESSRIIPSKMVSVVVLHSGSISITFA